VDRRDIWVGKCSSTQSVSCSNGRLITLVSSSGFWYIMNADMNPASLMSKELISPCGMNCALCSGYLALRHDVKNKGVPIPYCTGCRPRDKQCAFLKKRCHRLVHTQVEYCFECPEFPCKDLQHLDNRYRALFHMSMIENLQYIKKHGINKFLEKEQNQWKCSTCGDVVCCHNGICFHCGISVLQQKKKRYRWEE